MGTGSLHFLWLFDGQNLRKSDKVSHNNMTQVASVLAVATVFISLRTLISRQRRGLIHETNIPMQEGT